jgi:endoglucanase
MKDLIKKFAELTGPSGYESQVREAIRAEIEPYAEEHRVDALGNLIAVKGSAGEGSAGEGSAGEGKKIMLAAHMDEIGVMVTHIDENGFVRFTPLGGVSRQTCVGGRVRFLNGVPGVIGHEHLEDKNRLPNFDQMFIDVGAASRASCPVQVGDIAAFDRPFSELGDRWVSKALDDRVGVAILVETLRQVSKNNHSLPNQVFFVFSVQEEVGLRGATTAAFGVAPDIGLAVDVTATGDIPKGLKMEVGLGKGPAIKVRDEGMLADRRVVDWVARTAEGAGLPYQLEVLQSGTTDARAVQLSRSGVPAGCISIPCRYIHAPSEMVDSNDIQNAATLLVELLQNPVELK